MSRWLANVNKLLERLDGTVEVAIDEQRNKEADEDLDFILAKRGLSEVEEAQFENNKESLFEQNEEDDIDVRNQADEEYKEEYMDLDEQTKNEEKGEELPPKIALEIDVAEENLHADEINTDPDHMLDVRLDNDTILNENEFPVEENKDAENGDMLSSEFTTVESTIMEVSQLQNVQLEGSFHLDSQLSKQAIDTEKIQQPEEAPLSNEHHVDKKFLKKQIPRSPQSHIVSLAATPSSVISEEEYKRALSESREALKESRTLRRHVVSLNKQLETAESELDAQRAELQQAGEKLEKDRKKFKEEKEKLLAKQMEDVKTLKKQHEQIMSEIKSQHHDEIQKIQTQLKVAEEQRMQEGGNMTMELQNALQREQDLVRKMVLMEDAKETLLNQISQLQEQQDFVQSRFDSISQTADNAMMREREAEEKLDMALTMHARQIAQRQARETELERIISELSSSLATTSSNPGSEGDSAAGAENINVLKSQIYTLEEDLETYKTRLEAERQRVMIMQQELRDMSKERTHEINAARAKQHQFDRQMADMSLQISKLQSSLREAQRGASNTHDNSSGHVDAASRVKELTQELVRNQEKMGTFTSELSTLRNRLQVAIARAEKAENALTQVQTVDIESGTESGNFQGFGVRRRKKELPSIRDAINLQNSQNENIERVAKVIDGLDRFSVETGKFLRHNPLARGGFILYLLLLHLWTFAILFLHTHRFEDVHGDFGAGRHLAHSPYALMQNSNPVQGTKLGQVLQSPDSPLADEKKLPLSALTSNTTEFESKKIVET